MRSRTGIAVDVRVMSGDTLDVGFWHLTDKSITPAFVRYWTESGHRTAHGLDVQVANDP